MTHSGDNLTGDGSGDDEVINIRLDLCPAEVEEIVFVVNVFNGTGGFRDCYNSYIALRADSDHDASDGRNLAEFKIGANIPTRGLIFAKLLKHHEGWSFRAIGEGCGGNHVDTAACLDVLLGRKPGVDIPPSQVEPNTLDRRLSSFIASPTDPGVDDTGDCGCVIA